MLTLLPVKLHAVGRTSPEAILDCHFYPVSAMRKAYSPGEQQRDEVGRLTPGKHSDT